jgi:hypothetical protein
MIGSAVFVFVLHGKMFGDAVGVFIRRGLFHLVEYRLNLPRVVAAREEKIQENEGRRYKKQ